jgi:hypothetical protein
MRPIAETIFNRCTARFMSHSTQLGNPAAASSIGRSLRTAVAAGLAVILSLATVRGQGQPIHASVSFAPPVILTTSQSYLTSLAVADFDLDGLPDVVVVSPNLVVWYRNNGNGTFGAQQTISTAVPTPTCVFAADLDHDGRPDVAVSSLLDNTISWFRNVGGGGGGLFAFNAGAPSANIRIVSTSAEGALSVSAADLDNDGLRDLLSTSSYDRKVAWYRNLGGGNFGSPASNQNVISTAGISPSSIKAADLDGDGVRDLVVTSVNDNTIAWFKGSLATGTPQFTRYVISNSQLRASDSALADFDGDGWLDVACAASYGNTVTWFRNRTHDAGSAAPFFGTGQVISGNTQGVFALAASDMDNDTRPDMVAASLLANKITWYQNQGAGNFGWNAGNPSANEQTVATNTFGATAVAAADFNLDGKTDVVSGSQNDGKVAVFLNLGGQCAMASINTAPGSMIAGSRDDLLRIAVSNRGLPGDNSAKISTLTLLLEKNPGSPMTTAEANLLIENIQVFVDSNNSGSLEFGSDAAVGSVDDLQLSGGRLAFAPQPANPADITITPGATRNFFVVARLTASAAAQNPNTFRVTHMSQGAGRSVIVDAVSSASLTVESATNPDAPSSLVTAAQPHTYADWRVIHFDGASTPWTGPTESQFSDGIVNLLKYAFVADPLINNGAVSLPQIKAVGGTKIFRHQKPSWATDLTYQYEISREMLSWGPAVNGVDYHLTETTLPNGVVQRDLTILGNWTRSFMRVQSTLAN